MDLGIFSVSLAVKDIGASRKFYETLGFKAEHGDEAQKWLIMINGDAKIGLFEGMFEDNILTFHPLDARTVEKTLREAGYSIDKGAEGDEGPCHTVLKDPDGNVVMFDQF
ncbi:VOC family protein [Kordiimonas gwangyangensis]|uniref:VOC family protein n=1 Tax=Kordiimonas gwangyangensis TaxID=288022 RepID=UPI000362CC76|nr:VOC family protein [Kordiimonas gwangyangensis]